MGFAAVTGRSYLNSIVINGWCQPNGRSKPPPKTSTTTMFKHLSKKRKQQQKKKHNKNEAETMYICGNPV